MRNYIKEIMSSKYVFEWYFNQVTWKWKSRYCLWWKIMSCL